MTTPALIFGFIVSTLFGVLFHLIRGGGAGKFLLYLIMGWAGFWAGQSLASYLGWTFASLGPLHIAMASLGAILFLLVGHWLSLVKDDSSPKRNNPPGYRK